ncbi:MAG: nickel insertion protein, partial [Cyanobacteria bacterium J06627_28]
MKIAYLECPTGIAGDMCLGALVHAGVPLAYLSQKLSGLGLGDEFLLAAETVLRNQQSATKVHVDVAANLSPSLQAHDHASHDHASHGHSHSHDHSHDHDHSHSHG